MAYINQKRRLSGQITTVTYLFIAENTLLSTFESFLKVI
jgi:hypothetical protein